MVGATVHAAKLSRPPGSMRSLCAPQPAFVRTPAAAPPARLHSAAPHAALPSRRRRCVSLHVAARPVAAAVAVRAACCTSRRAVL